MGTLISGFWVSSFIGKAIVLVQIAGSVILLAVVLGKIRAFAAVRASTRRIGHDIMGGEDSLSYYLARHHSSGSAIENIYTACCDRLFNLLSPEKRRAIAASTVAQNEPAALTRHEMNLVQSICDQKLDDEEIALERGMGIVTSIVALAPMLGLLGTVWGVLDAFAAIGETGSASIANMAPAISSALVTTVVGLLVAIPGVVMDSVLRARMRKIMSDLEGFADDLMGRIALEYQGRN
ncbi:MAG: MotA/TolQ/ExbB proton channel family protein [Kiritimatiellae bacterium]|nr:MotA/TolQ/ExbB proton channel family protein [Kiritimatiellia bacterium]